MKREGPKRLAHANAIDAIKNKVELLEKAQRKVTRDTKKKRAATNKKKRVSKEARMPGEGFCLKDGKKSGKSIIRATRAAAAVNDGSGRIRIDKSHVPSAATPIENENYEKYLAIMNTAKKHSIFTELLKEEQKKQEVVMTNAIRCHAINSGQYDMHPMAVGSFVLGGGRVLGNKED